MCVSCLFRYSHPWIGTMCQLLMKPTLKGMPGEFHGKSRFKSIFGRICFQKIYPWRTTHLRKKFGTTSSSLQPLLWRKFCLVFFLCVKLVAYKWEFPWVKQRTKMEGLLMKSELNHSFATNPGFFFTVAKKLKVEKTRGSIRGFFKTSFIKVASFMLY